MTKKWSLPFWVGEKLFNQEDLDLIDWTTKQYPDLSRTELARTICENLEWKAPNGKERVHSCLELMEKLEADGTLKFPEKRKLAPYKKSGPKAAPLPLVRIKCTLNSLQPVTVEPVIPEDKPLWDATMAAYHPYGFERAFGAHQYYWIYGHVAGVKKILGAFLFAAPAKDVKVRDQWLGWTQKEQQRFRTRIVSNSRMLILPEIDVPHLASHALGKVAQRLPEDWLERYGYAPVLLETFVTAPWSGTCYRAANWIHLGQTAGRQDRKYKENATIREIFVFPLQPDWREALTAENLTPPGPSQTEEINRAKIDEQRKQRFEMLSPFLDEKQKRICRSRGHLVW